MSDLNHKPADGDRQTSIDALETAANVKIEHDTPDECALAVCCAALVKQEPLDGDCHNVYDSLFDVTKHEIRSESPEMEHQRGSPFKNMSDLNHKPADGDRQTSIDALETAANVKIEHDTPDECALAVGCAALVKQEPLDGDCHNVYDSLFDVIKHEIRSESPEMEHQRGTSSAKEHTTTEDSKMDEASSVKQNCFKPRTQQTLNKDKDTDSFEMNREDSAQDGSVARCGDTHTGETLFPCHQCLYKAGYKSYLVAHMRTHTGEKPWCCKYCDYKSSRASDLKTHMRAHTGEKPYSCTYCNYKCSTSSLLKSHMRTHTGEKPYSCKYCDYKCSQTSTLKSHMITHTGEKPHYCKYCDYKCSRTSSLKSHMITHTGEKPHYCKYCDYKCSRTSSLKSHMITHTGEKPHYCKYCDFKSSRASDLNSHMRTHTGDKPHSCKYCDYKSSLLSTLKRHMKTQHK